MGAPLLVMLAGPNGAGKSTFYESHLQALGLPFLNADNLARETGLDAYGAADAIAAIRDRMILRSESFVTETVLSDPVGEKVESLREAAERGFDVTLIYIGIEDADLSRRRVEARVAAGGHDVPPEKLDARYQRSLDNLGRAIEQLPRVRIYDNSSFRDPHRFLGEFRSGGLAVRTVDPLPGWARRFFT
jgi:predicted ABC-type ATPase